MNKKEIENKYNKKITQIKSHNKNYYDKNKPQISDKDYDELKKDILILESKHDYLHSKDSPSQNVGFKPSKNFVKVNHKVPMLSLSNAFDKKDMKDFIKKLPYYLIKRINFI